MRGAIGDYCCRFCDKEGNILYGDLYNRTIGIDLEELKKVPTVIGIARSNQKSRTILSMVKGGYINVLITDEDTALQMLEHDNDMFHMSMK